MKKLRIYAAIGFIFFSLGLSAHASSIEFDRIEGSTVFLKGVPPELKSSSVLNPGLYDLNYLGVLRPEVGLPYFLLSAKPCKDCMADRAIFAVRPNSTKPTSFVYPGRILDPKTRTLLFEGRTFFGKCLPQYGDVLVVFQREQVDRRHGLQKSVYVAEAAKDYLDEQLIERKPPDLKVTLQRVKSKQCREIEGRNRLMLKQPLDLHPRDNGDQEEEEEAHQGEGDSVLQGAE